MSRLDASGAVSDSHLVTLWLTGRPESTVSVYQPVVEAFVVSMLPKGVRDLTVADVIEWSDGLVGATATRARLVSTIKSFLSFAWRTGYTSINVGRMLKCIKVIDKLTEKWMDEDQVRSVVAAAPEGRDRALVRLIYVGGLRISEASKLRWIDVTPGRVAVVGKGAKARTVVVSTSVTDALMATKGLDAAPTDPVFVSYTGRSLDVRNAREIVYKAAKRAGLKLSPHWLRHAHASHAVDRGAPLNLVQRSLGHANVSTTSRYLHARPNSGSSTFLAEV